MMGLFKKKKSCCCNMEIVEEKPEVQKNNSCGCGSETKKESKAHPEGGNLKAFIDVRFCGANKDHCWPMQNCPNQAIESIPDEKSGFGHRFVVNEEKCDGCGICIDHCCGDCMELHPAP